MHENKPFKSHEYAPIKYPHTYLLLVLEQNKTKETRNKTKRTSKTQPKPSNKRLRDFQNT